MLDFLSDLLTQPIVQRVTLGSILVCLCAATIGVFTFLQKRSLLGDAIAHALLPGICIGFLLVGYKNTWVILAGAFVSGWLGILTVDYIQKRSKTQSDTALAIVLSVFFGLGVFLLSIIQHSGNPNQAGLDRYLFGNAASLSREDLVLIISCSAVLLLALYFGFRAFASISFDADYSAGIGFPIKLVQFVLSSLTVLTISIGVQAMGVVLIAALLIAPATAARLWTNKLSLMVILAGSIGVLSGFSGAWISYAAPNMPSGPWMVCVASILVIGSLVFAPKGGILARRNRLNRNRTKVLTENLLKLLYQLSESDKDPAATYTKNDLVAKREFPMEQLTRGLRKLVRNNLVHLKEGAYSLSSEGMLRAKQVVRNHRLWELYLTTYVGMRPDHVHEDAEAMEHLITPEIERELVKKLKDPKYDPHQSKIPVTDGR